MTILEYFNAALSLKRDETLMIPCRSESEQETVRTRLFFLRKQAREQGLAISRFSKDDKLYITLKLVSIDDAFIMNEAGEITPILIPDTSLKDLERIVLLSLKDKIQLEELINSLGGIFPAEKIEEEYNRQKAEME